MDVLSSFSGPVPCRNGQGEVIDVVGPVDELRAVGEVCFVRVGGLVLAVSEVSAYLDTGSEAGEVYASLVLLLEGVLLFPSVQIEFGRGGCEGFADQPLGDLDHHGLHVYFASGFLEGLEAFFVGHLHSECGQDVDGRMVDLQYVFFSEELE